MTIFNLIKLNNNLLSIIVVSYRVYVNNKMMKILIICKRRRKRKSKRKNKNNRI